MYFIKIKLIAIFLLFNIFSYSQTLIGVYGGYDKSNFFDNSSRVIYTGQYTSVGTFVFGVNAKSRWDQFLNLNVGLDYLKRESEFDVFIKGYEYWIQRNFNLNFSSINIRVAPEIKIGHTHGVYFNIGPYLGYLFDVNLEGTGTRVDTNLYNNMTWIDSGSGKSEFNGFDFGISTTIGCEFNIFRKFYINAEVSYGMGISNLAQDEIGLFASPMNTNNLFITAGLSYYIDWTEIRLKRGY